MDMSKKEDVVEYLKFIRKNRLCAYLGDRCDCKFGIDATADGRMSERTGCPEMYQLIDYMDNLPKEAWELAVKLSRYPKEQK